MRLLLTRSKRKTPPTAPTEASPAKKVKTATGAISSPQTTVIAPENLHSTHTQVQITPTASVTNVPNAELHPQATDHQPADPDFRCSIANSDLSRAQHGLQGKQIARSQVPTTPQLSAEEAIREALKADKAVADKLAEVEELRKEWLITLAEGLEREHEGGEDE